MIDVDGGTSYLVDVFRVVAARITCSPSTPAKAGYRGGLQLVAQARPGDVQSGVPMPARPARTTDLDVAGLWLRDQLRAAAVPGLSPAWKENT